MILREQREKFLPLRVIKDRIDSGEIDTGDADARRAACRTAPSSRPGPQVAKHPAAAEPAPSPARRGRPTPARRAAPAATTPGGSRRRACCPGVLVNRDELCAMASVTPDQLAQLEDYGVVTEARRGRRPLRRGRRRDRRRRRRVPARRRRRPPPAGLADVGRARGRAVRAADPAGAAPAQPAGPRAGRRAARRARRARRQAAGGDDARRRSASTSNDRASRVSVVTAGPGYDRVVVPLELVGVRVEVPANTPMVLLREQTGRQRLLPIYIGTPEATSIHYALEGVTPPRPLTHDLFVQTLAELGVSLEQIVVTEMRDHTYFAELHLRRAEGNLTVLSSRPSDAIALAVRCRRRCSPPRSCSTRSARSRPPSPRKRPRRSSTSSATSSSTSTPTTSPEPLGAASSAADASTGDAAAPSVVGSAAHIVVTTPVSHVERRWGVSEARCWSR